MKYDNKGCVVPVLRLHCHQATADFIFLKCFLNHLTLGINSVRTKTRIKIMGSMDEIPVASAPGSECSIAKHPWEQIILC